MIEFKLPDMSCGHCVGVVTRTVHETDPQATVEVDLPSQTVRIQSAGERRAFADALAEAGYPTA